MKYMYGAQCGYYMKGMGLLMDCKLYDCVSSKSFKLLGVICKIIFTF